MHRTQLVEQIRQKKSYLCLGLDTDIEKIPAHLRHLPDPVLAFNKAIIDATKDYCVSYKINTAFYECVGAKGWEILEETVRYIPSGIFTIADAKRGDIGNTSRMYAKTFFDTYHFDAVTVAPYMGEDSVRPFLEHPDKWTIVLGLTSNPGANDFEMLQTGNAYLYEKVITTAMQWGTPGNLMFVVGATQAASFASIRRLSPEHFFLVPGVGAQGGSLSAVSTEAMNADVGLLVNASRAVIYASGGEDYAEKAGLAAAAYQQEMQTYL